MAAPAAVLSILVKANTGGATSALIRVNEQLGATESRAHKTANALKTIGKASAFAAAGVGAASVKLAVDFDKSMRNVNSIAQLPEKQFVKLSKSVRQLGGKTAQAPQTLADGLYDLVSSGFDARQSMVILSKSARAATAGLTDTATSTKAVAAVLNAYHMRAKDAGKVSDELFRTVDRGVITFEDLANNIGDTLPFAASLGVRLHEVGAATATMTKQGLGASETMTRIRNVLQTLIKPGKDLDKTFKQLGVSGGEELIKKTGGLQAALQAIAGSTDGTKSAMAKLFPNIRALGGALALTGTNSRSAAQDLKGMENASGATARALAEQSKSVSYQWNKLKAQAESLAIGFGNKLLPEISKVLKMLSDPNLTGEQKLNRLAEMLSDMINRAIPKIMNAAGQAAPKVAEAFVKGFLAADVWAKLLGSLWLVSKLGGFSAFRKAGATAGAEVGAGMATGVATSGLKGRLTGMLKSWGPGLGLALGLTIGPEIVKGLARGKGTIPTDARAANVQNVTAGAEKIKATSASLQEMTAKLKAASGAWRTLAEHAESSKQREYFEQLADAVDKVGEPMERAENAMRRLARGASNSIEQLRTNVRLNMKAIGNAIDVHSAAGKEALSRNFGAAIENVRRSMREGTIATKAGTREIERLMMRALTNFGFSKAQALNYARSPVGDTAGKSHSPGSRSTFQRGGPITEGASSGDTVPAVLERGEYVVNRKAVSKVGRKALDALNFGAAPRFQTGGMVAAANRLDRAHFPYVWGGGHQGSPAPFGPMDCSGAVSFVLQHGGVKIPTMVSGALMSAGKPGPGPVTVFANAAHTFMRIGGRYFGTSATNPGGGAGWFPDPGASYRANFTQRHFTGAMGGLGKIARILVDGPDSALKGVVQGALDTARGGANAKLADLMASSIGGGDPGDPGPGYGKAQLAALWKRVNGRLGNANLMAAIALAESGGNPAARNPSGASGLWQILGLPFKGDPFDPETNARMAGAKLRTQGLGAWEVYTKGTYRQFLQKGGPVGMLFGGDPFENKSGFPSLPFSGRLAKLQNTVRHAKPRKRRKAIRNFLKTIKGVGLPPKVEKQLKTLAENADIFAGYADRAGALNVMDDNGNVTVPGLVNGHNEVEWLTQELDALFQWRNEIIRAQELIVAKRDKITGRIMQARQRMQTVVDTITGLKATRKRLQDTLTEAQRHPKGKRALIKGLKGRLGDVDRKLRKSGRERETLKTIIGDSSSGLLGQRSGLNTARGDLLVSLEDVQGVGSPMSVLKALPGLGVLGGRIFDTQMRLRDLGEKPSITDTTAAVAPGFEELQQLLREANLRTAVSERQFQVFRDMPQFGGGGIVSGPAGAAVPAVVHAGEGVFTPEQMAAMGTGMVAVIVQDGAVDKSKIRVIAGEEAERVTRRQATRGARGLPGGGGGLLK